MDHGLLVHIIENHGPTKFSLEDTQNSADLYLERAALFYTPTENILEKYIGTGNLDIYLPIVTPTYFESLEFHKYPRIWVDLLQRATGKIRWRSINPFRLTIVRYDTEIHANHVEAGMKALIDALKEKTSGRSDGKNLYYFGAIIDDSPKYMSNNDSFSIQQKLVESPSESKTRIIIESR